MERPRLMAAQPTTLNPITLAMRQLADEIDKRVSAGASPREAVDQVPVHDRAEVATALGFGEAAVAVALRDVATLMTVAQPVISRGVAAYEKELRLAEEAAEDARRERLQKKDRGKSLLSIAKLPWVGTVMSIIAGLIAGIIVDQCNLTTNPLITPSTTTQIGTGSP